MKPISDEDRAIIAFLVACGVKFTPPSPGELNEGSHAAGSFHYIIGTNGTGLAVDFVGPDLLAIFNAFSSVHNQLAELIWNNPAAQNRQVDSHLPGRLVAIYDTSPNASSHVHVSVHRGTFLKHPGGTPVANVDAPYVAHCVFYSAKIHDKASAAIHADGSVYCDPPNAYEGGANGKPYWGNRVAKDIRDNHQGGYTITDTANERYSFPEGTNPAK